MTNRSFALLEKAIRNCSRVRLSYNEKLSAASVGALLAKRNYTSACGDKYEYYLRTMEDAIILEGKKKYKPWKVESKYSLDKAYGETQARGRDFLRAPDIGPDDKVIFKMFREELSREENCFLDVLTYGYSFKEVQPWFCWTQQDIKGLFYSIQGKYEQYDR